MIMEFVAVKDFQQDLLTEEYRPATVRRYGEIVQRFQTWAMEHNTEQTLSVDTFISEYLNPDDVVADRPGDYKNVRAALHAYRRYLIKVGHSLPPHAEYDPLEWVIDNYTVYLAETAGLAAATRLTHQQYLRRFLRMAWREQHSIDPSIILSVSNVQHFLVDELKHLRPCSKKRIAGVIRSFVRYVMLQGVTIDTGLLSLPLTSPVWKLSHIPKTLPSDDIQGILSSYDRATDKGCRDYAIAVCLIDLGLRTVEVAQLRLDDFRWHEGIISIRKTKTHLERELPLPRRVGEAVVQYLKQSRPATAERTLFVRFARRSGAPMGVGQIRGTVRRAYARAGLPSSITSIHILRHTKAAALYEQGSSLKMIADVLGHTSIDTTVIYTKVGGASLHKVMGQWPTLSSDTPLEVSR
jgi:site-specific recombinase XerD